MRCASGGSYAIAFQMALLSLVWLPQVPARAAATDVTSPSTSSSSTSAPPLPPTPSTSSSSSLSNPPAMPTQHFKSSPSSMSPDTARSPTSNGRANVKSSTRTLRPPPERKARTETWAPANVFTTERKTAQVSGMGSLDYYGGHSSTEASGGTDLQVMSSRVPPTNAHVCDSKCRDDDVMVRKQGICGCNAKISKRPFLKSGIKRSTLNTYRPTVN